MSEIALCMIVKNEERYLEECLLSVQNVVSEIVVVDTGSTDNTKKIAAKFGAKIFDFQWQKDFSAARNFALSKAESKWILYLDADERLDKKSVNLVKQLAAQNKKAGYFCNVISPSETAGAPSVMKFLRFFRNHPSARFTGKVHEQIEPALRSLGYELLDSEIVIKHEGYNVDKTILRQKAKRNLELLIADFSENPSSYNAFQIGQTYLMLDDAENAHKYFLIVLEKNNLDESHMAQTYRYLGAYELSKKNLSAAKNYVLEGLKLSPASPLLHILAANVSIELGETQNAAKHAKQAYIYNNELLEGKRASKFDVLVNENNMLLYGINLALMILDRELFSWFYPKLQKTNLSNSDKLLLGFYNEIFTYGEVRENTLKNFPEIRQKIDEKILAGSIKFLNDNFAKEKLRIIAGAFPRSFEINFSAGEKLFESDPEQSLAYFENAHKLNPNDLQTIWHLFNLYFSKLDINKLETLYRNVREKFPENQSLISVFNRIITKLKNLPDASGK